MLLELWFLRSRVFTLSFPRFSDVDAGTLKLYIELVFKVISQKGRIAAARERFNRIRMVAPICTPRLTHASLDPRESVPQTASRSVQPFLQSSRSWQFDIQTYRPTDRSRYSVYNNWLHRRK